MEAPWQVVGQRETFAPNPLTNNIEPMVKVTFRTATGAIASVNVPVDNYNVDTVRSMIDAYAEQLNAVHQLGQATS